LCFSNGRPDEDEGRRWGWDDAVNDPIQYMEKSDGTFGLGSWMMEQTRLSQWTEPLNRMAYLDNDFEKNKNKTSLLNLRM
jgi:hypothetical protein